MSDEAVFDFINKAKYFPNFLRDADSQSALFEFIYIAFKGNDECQNPFETIEKEHLEEYILKFFFPYMALHGIVLRKINPRVKSNFLNLESAISNFKKYLLTDDESLLHSIYAKQDSTVDRYRNSLDYLPTYFKDFHNRKEIFLYLHNSERDKLKLYFPSSGIINERDGHILIVDYVLWILSKYGYKLQRHTKNLGFKCIVEESFNYYKFYREQSSKALMEMSNKKISQFNGV